MKPEFTSLTGPRLGASLHGSKPYFREEHFSGGRPRYLLDTHT
jgi:hypothetical protein